MATRRPPAAAVGVREALIAKLAGHVRQTVDPRFCLDPGSALPADEPPYVDYIADQYDDLMAGRAVDVEVWRFAGICEVPPGCHAVHVDVDGSLSAASYERLE